MQEMKRIAVIGAGLSGTLLTVNLLKRDYRDTVEVTWIDPNRERDMGFAYSTDEDYLLNVPVELMSAYSPDPESFLRWSQSRDKSIEPGAYLPRKWFREYVGEMLKIAIEGKKDNIHLKRITGQATGIKIENDRTEVLLENSDPVEADKVVLAIGNPLPGNPVVGNKEYIHDKRYNRNPWDPGILEGLSAHETILFIGTGQTMVDLVTGLYKRKHKGKLIAVSRKGIIPLAQKKVASYPSFYDELRDLSDTISLFQVVRRHLETAEEMGLDQRAVIDSLRPHSCDIWMNLPPAEKKRFLRHLFRYWEVIRSRIPPDSEWKIKELIKTGQLKILAGRISDIIPAGVSMQVNFKRKNENVQTTLLADRIINCKGPDLDYENAEQPLLKNLMMANLIECDPVHLGINALPEGAVLTGGIPSEQLYTIGPPLKGILWESIATPEIRVQAENLSRLLVEN